MGDFGYDMLLRIRESDGNELSDSRICLFSKSDV